jgi:hypothetical protein
MKVGVADLPLVGPVAVVLALEVDDRTIHGPFSTRPHSAQNGAGGLPCGLSTAAAANVNRG